MEWFMDNIQCLKGQEEDITKHHVWKDATTTYALVFEAGKEDISL